MNTKGLLALSFILAALTGCYYKNTPKGDLHTLFVQAPLDLPPLQQMRHDLWPAINDIIAQELGQEQDDNFPIFFFKKRQAITVYYINDLYDSGEPMKGLFYLFISPAFQTLQNNAHQEQVSLSPQLEFFGELRPGLHSTIELVTLIDDPHKLLSQCNSDMKQAMRHANNEYKRAYGINLYDIQKSERFPYLPHLSLGHLRINYLKYLINDTSKEDAIIERIKERIKQVVLDALTNLSPDDRNITIDTLAIFDLRQRKYVEEITLEEAHGS